MATPSQINTSSSPSDVAKWVWRNLVPKSGPASSVQGELLRSIERLRCEAQENGNINWDGGFELFITFLRDTLLSLDYLSSDEMTSIERDLDRLHNFVTPDELTDDHSLDDQLPYVEDDVYDRLTAHILEFCRRHPAVIPMQPDPRQYR